MPSERARVIALLDELQAAERAGAQALGRWLTACRDPLLRGGLRVIRARDTAHAVLAEERLRALGGVPSATASRSLESLCAIIVAPDTADRAKIAVLLGRFPSEVRDPFEETIGQIENDGETRALLEAIGDDERASLEWLRRIRDEAETDGVAMSDRGPLLRFLDAYRAAETVGAEVLMAWVSVCPLGGLRGGLRAIAAREATHASLLAERLRDLGERPRAALAPGVRSRALAHFGARDVPDETKLATVLARGDGDHAADGVRNAGGLADDHETRALLALIAAGEASTTGWFRAYHAAMVGRQGGAATVQAP